MPPVNGPVLLPAIRVGAPIRMAVDASQNWVRHQFGHSLSHGGRSRCGGRRNIGFECGHVPRHDGPWPRYQQHARRNREDDVEEERGADTLATTKLAPTASPVWPLMGLLTGAVVGAGLGALRAAGWRPNLAAGSVAAGAAAMIGSNMPMAGMGVSDPRSWKASEWFADLIPQIATGSSPPGCWMLRIPSPTADGPRLWPPCRLGSRSRPS